MSFNKNPIRSHISGHMWTPAHSTSYFRLYMDSRSFVLIFQAICELPSTRPHIPGHATTNTQSRSNKWYRRDLWPQTNLTFPQNSATNIHTHTHTHPELPISIHRRRSPFLSQLSVHVDGLTDPPTQTTVGCGRGEDLCGRRGDRPLALPPRFFQSPASDPIITHYLIRRRGYAFSCLRRSVLE